MKLMQSILVCALLLSTAVFGEVKSVTICDHNKGEYALAGLDKRKINNNCVNCSTTGLGGKCFVPGVLQRGEDEIRIEYGFGSEILIVEDGYPTKDIGMLIYDDWKDQFKNIDDCVKHDHYLEQTAKTTFEIRKCH